jgi:H+/Cl- antiporter ClcA
MSGNEIHEKDEKDNIETFINMNNDSQHFNTILVLGLFIVLFSFVYMYGFHGILKFEKNFNYLLAILFCGLAMIMILIVIIQILGYITNDSMSEFEKTKSRSGILTMIVLIIFFKMMALIKYNYSKLFAALNKTLPKNKNK